MSLSSKRIWGPLAVALLLCLASCGAGDTPAAETQGGDSNTDVGSTTAGGLEVDDSAPADEFDWNEAVTLYEADTSEADTSEADTAEADTAEADISETDASTESTPLSEETEDETLAEPSDETLAEGGETPDASDGLETETDGSKYGDFIYAK